jgi:hypothetical protein
MPPPDNGEGRSLPTTGPQSSNPDQEHVDNAMLPGQGDDRTEQYRLAIAVAYAEAMAMDLDAWAAWGEAAVAHAEDPLAVLASAVAIRVARLERERASSMDTELEILVTSEHRELFRRGGAR